MKGLRIASMLAAMISVFSATPNAAVCCEAEIPDKGIKQYGRDDSTQRRTEAFVTLLNEAGREKLATPLEELRGDGYEIRDQLLIPVLRRIPPVEPVIVEAKTANVFDTRGEDIERVMSGQVRLLGGIPWQKVGDPVDWFIAPHGDLQWTTHLNRHYFLIGTGFAYRNSGDRIYSDKIVRVLLNWIEHFPLGVDTLRWIDSENSWSRRWSDPTIPASTQEGLFHGYSDGPWTALSAEARVTYWLEILQLIQESPSLTNDVMAQILISLMHDHRQVMMDYPRQMNQYQAVANGLVLLGIYFPYLTGSDTALQEGISRLEKHTLREIYPDGSMAECSPNYGMGMLKRLSHTIRKLRQGGIEVPEIMEERLNLGLRYMALIADPLLRSPRIAKGGGSLRGDFEHLVKTLEAPTLMFRLSGDGKEIETVVDDNISLFPSLGFHWVGHFVFRSGWDSNATWMFFEPGPRGTGHANAAQLGLQLMSRGEWLLTDPGFYSYSRAEDSSAISRYLNSTAAHNLVLVDGVGQRMTPVGEPGSANETTGDYGWETDVHRVTASGSYDYGFGEAGDISVIHHRQVTFHPEEDRFEIVDTLSPMDRKDESVRELEWRWQLHPGAAVDLSGSVVAVSNGKARMQLQMSGHDALILRMSMGERDPPIGWFSEKYGILEPAPTLKAVIRSKLPLTIVTMITVSDAITSEETEK